VELLDYLRPERRFGSPDELVAQLQADVAAVLRSSMIAAPDPAQGHRVY